MCVHHGSVSIPKANQKKFLDSVQTGVMKKINKLLEQGLDPNFIAEDGSKCYCPFFHSVHFDNMLPLTDTPLGVCCGRDSHIECILPLISSGSHIDYRGKDGLTPVHRAAIGGNTQALKVSPDGDSIASVHRFLLLTPQFTDAVITGGIP